MDSILCLFFIIVALFIKVFYINDSCYKILRLSHSKTYIKKNYSGFKNWLYFKGYFKEVKLYFILNITLLAFALCLLVLFFLSFFFDMTAVLKLVIIMFLALSFIEYLHLMLRLVLLGETARGKVGPLWRIFALIVLIVIIISVISLLWERFIVI